MENYTSDSSDSDNSAKIIDLAYLLLDSVSLEENLEKYFDAKKRFSEIESVILHHNQLSAFPESIFRFPNLNTIDLSNNGLKGLPDIPKHCPLVTLILKNNQLTNESLSKNFSQTSTLKELNLSGNSLEYFPEQICDIASLKYLYLGGNKIKNISRKIHKLTNIQILSFGGNQIVEVPAILGQLKNLHVLVLCDNKIETLPANIANLHNLKSLQLHKNCIKVLPPEIIALKNLTELSLRDNPLIVQFVTDMCHNPATLLELAARTIKLHNIQINGGDVPNILIDYLNSAHHCVNPKCKGVYFDNRIEHIKFVDFCGKYRIPLLQYLCSAKCRKVSNEDMIRPSRSYMMKKVLLG